MIIETTCVYIYICISSTAVPNKVAVIDCTWATEEEDNDGLVPHSTTSFSCSCCIACPNGKHALLLDYAPHS